MLKKLENLVTIKISKDFNNKYTENLHTAKRGIHESKINASAKSIIMRLLLLVVCSAHPQNVKLVNGSNIRERLSTAKNRILKIAKLNVKGNLLSDREKIGFIHRVIIQPVLCKSKTI